MVVPDICASNTAHLTNFVGDKHAWPRYLTVGNIRNDICCTPQMHTWILVGLIPCPQTSAKHTDEASYHVVGTGLGPPFRNLDMTGPSLQWTCADAFQSQYYSLLAAWVRDYPEIVIVCQVSEGVCLMCEILTGAPMGLSTLWPLDNSRDQHAYSELLNESTIHVLPPLHVHPIQTSSGNTLSVIFIGFGSMINCISSS